MSAPTTQGGHNQLKAAYQKSHNHVVSYRYIIKCFVVFSRPTVGSLR